jgi:hypothetical protein
MIECKICGHKVRYRLIEHIIKTHKMDINFYKDNYGDVVSEDYKLKVSNKSKEMWKDDDYRNKIIKSREWIYSDKELNKKRIESIKTYYDNGGKVWNDGLTKENDDRLKIIGDKNRKKLSGRTKDDYDYLKKHSDRMKELWSDSKLKEGWLFIQNNEELKKVWKNKISDTISEKIINGEINTMSSFNNGWYENKKGKHWYCSNLEKDTMILFDDYNIIWDNNKIRIKYLDKNGEVHYYIPDFIIKDKNNNDVIIEMKGFDWDGLTEIKSNYASKKHNYKLFYNINELKKYLDKYENNKN